MAPSPGGDEAAARPDPAAAEEAARVLGNLTAAGVPAAVLAGDWFGVDAVVAPGALARPTAFAEVFPGPAAPSSPAEDEGPGPGLRLGWLPYSGEAYAGIAERGVLVLAGGRWENRGVAAGLAATALGDSPAPAPAPPRLNWDRGDRAAHQRGVAAILEHIRAGDIYQACLSTRLHATAAPPGGGAGPAPAQLAAQAWFAAKLRAHHPARAAFLPGVAADGSGVATASLSPEEFLIRDGARVRSSPIKGTVPAGADPAELAGSGKDVAENIMIVDLVRHDLGRVARVGGVRVDRLLEVRPAPGVLHLVSTVAAELDPALPHAALIDACFPPASVTGTPKLRAAGIIGELEPEPRGVHCGAVGAAVGARLELNVAIRTVEFRGGPDRLRAAAGVGGGITIGSDAAAEWAEIAAKAAPLLG